MPRNKKRGLFCWRDCTTGVMHASAYELEWLQGADVHLAKRCDEHAQIRAAAHVCTELSPHCAHASEECTGTCADTCACRQRTHMHVYSLMLMHLHAPRASRAPPAHAPVQLAAFARRRRSPPSLAAPPHAARSATSSSASSRSAPLPPKSKSVPPEAHAEWPNLDDSLAHLNDS